MENSFIRFSVVQVWESVDESLKKIFKNNFKTALIEQLHQSQSMIFHTFCIIYVIYQTQETVFHHISKH